MNKNCSQTEGAKLGCKLEKGRRHMAFNLNNNMMNMYSTQMLNLRQCYDLLLYITGLKNTISIIEL